MDQIILMNNGKEINLQNDGLSTPSRTQKRLFVPSSNSSKRSLFREETKDVKRDIENVSDTESDLGPMSPLALTDRSSCDSSPGRQFVSPLATPEKSPIIPLPSWDRLISESTKNNIGKSISPFSSLKRVTRSARFSPRRIFELSPKSKLSQSSQNSYANTNITTLEPANKITSDVVPETPSKESDFDDQQSYVEETPQKDENSEYRLITPLGSICKNISVPRVHRRKSLSALDFDECTSPEIKKCNLKRHLEDSISIYNSKYQKTDELSSVPRARAALFQETNKNTSEKEKSFTLNTKSFYGSSDKSRKSVSHDWREPQPEVKKRRSLPSFSSTHRRSVKKHKKGEINCGVGHGIKRPKPKRQSLQNNFVKVEKQNINTKPSESKENLNPQIQKNNKTQTLILGDMDPNKKFFKTKPGNNANTTINNKTKISTNPNEVKHINKKVKLNESVFDTDLSVEEELIEKSKVDNILKILEDDWADDEYESMDTTQTPSLHINVTSPKKSNIKLKNLTMSPASELTSMASTMNIEDISMSRKSKNNVTNNIVNSSEGLTQKLYPLFSKGYSSNIIEEENNSKKRKRSTSWQLSTKYGNAENQYQIDAGQKIFGATQCNECGIIYQIGDPDDENAHLNYHNSFKNLKFQGWKNEHVVYNDSQTSSRIIVVDPKDSNLYWRKVTEILEIVDRDLGLSDMKLSFYRDKRVYLYIRDKTVLGVLVAEYIKNAFKMIPELLELNCCTSETTPVKCGVNVVWTAMSNRRQGIATKLVDTLRATYYFGYILTIEDIAFSTPTPSGKLFAERYTKTKNFKVY